MECNYCKKLLSSTSALNYHQKNTKSCNKLQGLNIDKKVECEYCNKLLSSKSSLKRHIVMCKNKYKFIEDELYDAKKHIELLTNTIKELRADKSNLQERYDNLSLTALKRNFEDEIDEFVCDTESDHEEYKLQPLEVSNGYTIEHREDGFINVTNLFKASKKQFSDWNELDETSDFLDVLSLSIGLTPNELIKYNICSNEERETWTHPQVSINIAQWISPTFDVKVSSWVYEAMMTGKVYITNTKSYKELQKENKNKDLKIQFLTKKYVKSQPRVQYNEKNVIYILTTKLMKKERRYILGKAIDLTSRLSTYNKSDEHEVIYVCSCKDVETMNIVENMVFSRLKEYREQANRERFVLPQNEKIELFSYAIKKSIEFIN